MKKNYRNQIKHRRYCKICHKKLNVNAKWTKTKYCIKCSNKLNKTKYKGKNNPCYRHGKYVKTKYCQNCGKELSKNIFARHCKKCSWNYRIQKDRHHIDLNQKNNKKSNILFLLRKTHKQLHSRAYNYLVETGLIKKYLTWFNKKYGLYKEENA